MCHKSISVTIEIRNIRTPIYSFLNTSTPHLPEKNENFNFLIFIPKHIKIDTKKNKHAGKNRTRE